MSLNENKLWICHCFPLQPIPSACRGWTKAHYLQTPCSASLWSRMPQWLCSLSTILKQIIKTTRNTPWKYIVRTRLEQRGRNQGPQENATLALCKLMSVYVCLCFNGHRSCGGWSVWGAPLRAQGLLLKRAVAGVLSLPLSLSSTHRCGNIWAAPADFMSGFWLAGRALRSFCCNNCHEGKKQFCAKVYCPYVFIYEGNSGDTSTETRVLCKSVLSICIYLWGEFWWYIHRNQSTVQKCTVHMYLSMRIILVIHPQKPE